MITAHPRAKIDQWRTLKARKTLMYVNGAFLALVGGAQVLFELLSYFRSVGPLGQIFAGSHYTIGFFEAHGLALLIGMLLIFVAAADPKRFWHGFAAGVHLLLGGANLLFWSSFAAWRLVPMGIAATVFHGLFLVAQVFCFAHTAASERKD